jgi:hypothetical protein
MCFGDCDQLDVIDRAATFCRRVSDPFAHSLEAFGYVHEIGF